MQWGSDQFRSRGRCWVWCFRDAEGTREKVSAARAAVRIEYWPVDVIFRTVEGQPARWPRCVVCGGEQ